MSFAKEIKEIRQKCFLSQNAFANELGVSFSTVNRWETGKTIPNCIDRKSTRLNSSHPPESRMPSSA